MEIAEDFNYADPLGAAEAIDLDSIAVPIGDPVDIWQQDEAGRVEADVYSCVVAFGSERVEGKDGVEFAPAIYVMSADMQTELSREVLVTHCSTAQAAVMRARPIARSRAFQIIKEKAEAGYVCSEETVTVAPYGRQRDREAPAPALSAEGAPVKRPRGRPRKNPLPAPGEPVVASGAPVRTSTVDAIRAEVAAEKALPIAAAGGVVDVAPITIISDAGGHAAPEPPPPPVKGHDKVKRWIRAGIEINAPIMLEGHTGVGKTSIIRELAREYDRVFDRVNLNGQTSIDEFVGRWLIKDGATVWQDGVLIRAMRLGHWLLCDEINAALPEILFVLHSLLDDDRYVRLVEKDGEIVRPHPDFRFIAARNPAQKYAGTKELNAALLSRFGVHVILDYPRPQIEVEVLTERTGVSVEDAVIMVDFAGRIRKLEATEAITSVVSTRDLIAWASLTVNTGDRIGAFKYAILNRAPFDDRKTYQEQIAAVAAEFKEFATENGGRSPGSILEECQARIQTAREAEELALRKIEEANARLDHASAKEAEFKERLLGKLASELGFGSKEAT